MGIKLSGCLPTLLITPSHAILESEFEDRVMILSFLLAERGNSCKSQVWNLRKSRWVSSQFRYDFCRNLMATRTGSGSSKFSRTFLVPGSSLRMSMAIFRLRLSNTVPLPMTHRIRELSRNGRGAWGYKIIEKAMLLNLCALVLSVPLSRQPSSRLSVCGTTKALFFKTQALSSGALSELLRQSEGCSSDRKSP